MARNTEFQSQVDSYQRLKKWYWIPLCLTLSIIRYVSKGKWSNPGKEVTPFPSHWRSSYWKGSKLMWFYHAVQINQSINNLFRTFFQLKSKSDEMFLGGVTCLTYYICQIWYFSFSFFFTRLSCYFYDIWSSIFSSSKEKMAMQPNNVT